MISGGLFWLILFIAILELLAWWLWEGHVKPIDIDPSVFEQFRKIMRRQLLMLIPVPLLAGFAFWLRGQSGHAGAILFPVVALVMAGCFVFIWRNWRCPKCDAYLGKYAAQTGVCPKCGTALRAPRKS